jgi:hypothetical protein
MMATTDGGEDDCTVCIFLIELSARSLSKQVARVRFPMTALAMMSTARCNANAKDPDIRGP